MMIASVRRQLVLRGTSQGLLSSTGWARQLSDKSKDEEQDKAKVVDKVGESENVFQVGDRGAKVWGRTRGRDEEVQTISEAEFLDFLSKPAASSIGGSDLAKSIPALDTTREVQETIQEFVGKKPFRTVDVYDPVDLVEGDPVREWAPFQRNPRPARLVVTGQEFHFTNLWLLSRFLTPLGDIMPRKRTGLTRMNQKKLTKAVKRARAMGLLPYLYRYNPGPLAQAEGEAEPNPLAEPGSARTFTKPKEPVDVSNPRAPVSALSDRPQHHRKQ